MNERDQQTYEDHPFREGEEVDEPCEWMQKDRQPVWEARDDRGQIFDKPRTLFPAGDGALERVLGGADAHRYLEGVVVPSGATAVV